MAIHLRTLRADPKRMRVHPGLGSEDRFRIGIFLRDERTREEVLIGSADICRGFPDRATAQLDEVSFTSEAHRGRDHEREALRLIEERVSRWAGIERFKTSANEKRIVSKKERYSMRALLRKKEVTREPALRPASTHLSQNDYALLGLLMERAFANTVDDEGETLDHFVAEAKAALNGKYGLFLPRFSLLLQEGARPVSATVVTLWKERPLLAFSITDPDFQGRGLATALLRETMDSMARAGFRELYLSVTAGNAPAERLYRNLGFEQIKTSPGSR